MTSCVEGQIRRDVVAVLAVLAVAALALAEQARAQAPPAAVDQYRPAPPGNPDPDPNKPGGPGNGPEAGGPGSGDGSPGLGVPVPGEEGIAAVPGDTEGAGGDEGTGGPSDGLGSAGDRDGGGERDSEGGGGPVVGGYPLTSALLTPLLAIAIGLCAAGGVAIWRRRRGGAALAGSS